MTTTQPAPRPAGQPKAPDPDLLIFVRHGQTDWNAEGRMQGQRDIPLNSVGEGQAVGNGDRLKAFFEQEAFDPAVFDFVSSPLTRTRATMELIRNAMALDPAAYRLESQLREITFGAWEGFTLEEVAEENAELVSKRRADKWGFLYPQGESYERLSVRVDTWLKTVDRPTVVVSHGGVFRVLRGLLEGLETAAVPNLAVPQDKVFVWRMSRFEEI